MPKPRRCSAGLPQRNRLVLLDTHERLDVKPIAVAVVVPLFFTATLCQAQQVVKNGLPCVAEICLGDGLPELGKVQWDRAKNPFSDPKKPFYTASRKLTALEMGMVQAQFRGNLNPVSAFLADGLFDSGSLPGLARITAACNKNTLFGTYTTASGNPTRVGISLIPIKSDPTRHQWTVTTIVRTLPAVVSSQQIAEAKTELNARYKDFDSNRLGLPRPGEGRFAYNLASDFGFHFFLMPETDELDRMKMHPACGGSAKVKVD